MPPTSPALILHNGKIWTEHALQPEVAAVAICGNTILAIGTSAEVLAAAGPQSRIIDLRGRRVVPGFNDAHVHFHIGGSSLASVQLRDAATELEFRDRISQFAKKIPAGQWILNGEWDSERWPGRKFPTKDLIDSVTPDHPVFLNRWEAHTMLANSVAMKLAGVDKNTRDLPGGVIERDAGGNPTGIFVDAAKALIERVIPAATEAQLVTYLRAAQAHAAQNGITSVQDMAFLNPQSMDAPAELLRAYQTLVTANELQTRVSLHTPMRFWRMLGDLGIQANFGNDKFQIGALKAFSDGALGSSTAWFLEPFTDNPASSGLPSDEMEYPERFLENMLRADAAGINLAIHAIGDRANRRILDYFEKVIQTNPARANRRLRIEHAQHLHPADIPRFARLGVIASVQPIHATDDGCWAERRIGHERAETTYAFRSLLDAGAVLAFGSDWWVQPISPIAGICAAVTRATIDGRNPDGWIPAQKITVAEAVHAYTVSSAYASGEEHVKGSLAPGKLADLVILSDDIFTIPPAEIQHAKIDATIFDGRFIYEREPL